MNYGNFSVEVLKNKSGITRSLLGEFKKVEAFKNSELLLLYEKLYLDLFED